MFEALPDTIEAVQALMNEASAWLWADGLEGRGPVFGHSLDMPLVVEGSSS